MLAGTALSSVVVLAALTSRADAHGYLEEPKPSWTSGGANVGWIAQVDNYWDIGSGGDQCGLFKTMSAEKKMSVRDVVLDMVGDKKCGNTDDSATPQAVPTDGMAKWLGNEGGGFTHVGPCEIYIDDKMVLRGDNCADEYPGGDVGSTVTSDMPVDYSSCNGDCNFVIYWLAFQNAQWQAYVNCVPLTGSGSTTQTAQSGTETGSEASSTETTEAPAAESSSAGTETTDAPTSETQATETPATETQTTEAPAADAPATTTLATDAPSTETEAPTTEAKCNAPARRLRKKTTTG